MLWNIRWNLHTTGIHRAKYDYPPSKWERGFCVTKRKTDFWPWHICSWPFTQVHCFFVLIYTSWAILVPNMTNLDLKIKLSSHCQRQVISIFLPLTFDSNVITIYHGICCYLHTIDSHCAKYEPPQSKHEVMTRKTNLKHIWLQVQSNDHIHDLIFSL